MSPSPTSDNATLAMAVLLGLVLVAGSWLTKANTNLLLLLIVWSMFTIGSLVVRRRALVGGLALFCFLLLRFPLEITSIKFIDPGAIDPDGRSLALLSIPPDQEWEYVFAVEDHERLEQQCGTFASTVFIDGMRLVEGSVNIKMIGTTLQRPPRFLTAYAFDEIQLTPELRGVREFRVSLTAAAGARPAIRQAPEVRPDTIYHDAVYLELKSPTCIATYHPLRRVQKT
jgi:hypothetical protein